MILIFEDATPKAIQERVAKYRRERKELIAASGDCPVADSPSSTKLSKARTPKAGTSGKAGAKRKRVAEQDDLSDDHMELDEQVKVEGGTSKKRVGIAKGEDDEVEKAELPMPVPARAKAMSRNVAKVGKKVQDEVKKEEVDGIDAGIATAGKFESDTEGKEIMNGGSSFTPVNATPKREDKH